MGKLNGRVGSSRDAAAPMAGVARLGGNYRFGLDPGVRMWSKFPFRRPDFITNEVRKSLICSHFLRSSMTVLRFFRCTTGNFDNSFGSPSRWRYL